MQPSSVPLRSFALTTTTAVQRRSKRMAAPSSLVVPFSSLSTSTNATTSVALFRMEKQHSSDYPLLVFACRPTTTTSSSRRHFSWFPSFSAFSSANSSSFNPLQASSATVLKQPDSELTPEEIILKNCLQKYQQQQQHDKNDDTNMISIIDDVDVDYYQILEELQQAYMSLEYWEEALGIEETKYFVGMIDPEEDPDAHADSLHTQGKFHLRLGDFGKSKQYYTQALDYFSKKSTTTTTNDDNINSNININHSVQRGHVLISLAGWHFFRSNDTTKAMELLQEAETLLDPNPTLMLKCLDNQGLIHRLNENYDAALECYQQALQLCNNVSVSVNSNKNNKNIGGDNDKSQRHAMELHIGDMLFALKRYTEALIVYNGILERSFDNPGRQGVMFHQMATIHYEMGQYDLAESEYQQAIALKEQAGGPHNPQVAVSYHGLGVVLQANSSSAGIKNTTGSMEKKVQALEAFQNVLWITRIHAGEEERSDPNVLQAIQMISKLEQEIQDAKNKDR